MKTIIKITIHITTIRNLIPGINTIQNTKTPITTKTTTTKKITVPKLIQKKILLTMMKLLHKKLQWRLEMNTM